ncbi:macro domain-containing protein [Streptomyces avermitilis]|uniref:macro domain-containing protein n=1 Tax=Streptomyces avermitilis TaxID=33903 RepID=UPI003F4CBB41
MIHTVGPVGREYGEAEGLASCYRRCLEVADELGAKTIAFLSMHSPGPPVTKS